MNKRTDERTLIASAVAALQQLGIGATAKADAIVIDRDGKRIAVDVKRSVTRAALGALSLTFSGRRDQPLLITDYVTPPVADELRKRHIEFVDTAGNAFIDRRGLMVVTSGRRPAKPFPRHRPSRLFRGAGLQVVFAILAAPELVAKPQREIARAASVALGSVAAAINGLRTLGFVADVRGKRRLVLRDRLLDRWTEAYAQQLAPDLDLARFAAPSTKWWRTEHVETYQVAWGGETAAAVLQRQLVPEQLILYGEKVPLLLLAEHRLRADDDGAVIFRRRFWNDLPAPRRDVVPPVLIYADLVAAGDARSLEAATRIRDAYLV